MTDDEEDTGIEDFDIEYRPRAYEELTLRDLFALTAMHSRVQNGTVGKFFLAEECYRLADEMLKRRAQ